MIGTRGSRCLRSLNDAFVADNAIVRGDIMLSRGVNIWYHCVLRGDLARITLGAMVNLQDGCIVHTDRDAPQEIEAGVVAGHAAILHGKRIGTDSLIGMGAQLLSGCEIGAECIVAAGALIPEGRIIPTRSLVMGAPGKVVRPVTDAEVERTRDIARRYLELARRHARGEFASLFDRRA